MHHSDFHVPRESLNRKHILGSRANWFHPRIRAAASTVVTLQRSRLHARTDDQPIQDRQQLVRHRIDKLALKICAGGIPSQRIGNRGAAAVFPGSVDDPSMSALRSRANQVTCPRWPATEMFSIIASPGSKEWSTLPPTLTEAGCHCGQFPGVVMKSKTSSMGWHIWMLLQMRVMHTFLRPAAGNLVEPAALADC
jgi:hypothetical protein